MVYAWLDNEKLFSKYLYIAKDLVEKMEANGEETPLVRRIEGERPCDYLL